MVAENHSRVLVLNRLWQAVNTCSWERAVTLLYTDHAEVVYEDEHGTFCTYGFTDWCDVSAALYNDSECMHSIRLSFHVPSIILLKWFDCFPCKEVKFTRSNIFERDNHTCQYCGEQPERKKLNIDHVMPRSRGGKTTWDNVVCSCVACNTRKGNRTPQEAGMYLDRDPGKPTWRPLVENNEFDRSWERFF